MGPVPDPEDSRTGPEQPGAEQRDSEATAPESAGRPGPEEPDSGAQVRPGQPPPGTGDVARPPDPESAGPSQAAVTSEQAPARAEPEDAGRLIGERYRLRTRLGGGAMGTVWSGVDEFLRRPVAVKAVRLPAGMSAEEAAELRERTLREARAIAIVAHPNVVTLYDVARDGGEPFVVMELVPSSSLATIVHQHGALDEPQLAVVAEAVASALQAAHSAGVVHRDVKPGNVLLADDGRIKLSDFGISRNLAEPTLTRTGIMLGTPAYIAPEVAAGGELTTAADLWGLGATLFAASEGHPPYDTGGNPLATVTSVVRGPVPVPDRGGPVGEVIEGLMVKDPAGRLPLAEVRRRVRPLLPEPGTRPFERLLSSEAPTVPTPHPQPRSPTRDVPAERSDPAPLAADPGPLPFTPREPVAPRRSGWRLGALVIGALLVFVLAAGGGFAATRLWAGRPVLPRAPEPAPAATVRYAPELVPFVGDTEYPSSEAPGRFTMPAPEGWTRFEEYRKGPPASSLTVHFVSPDGRVDLAVERYADYFVQGHTVPGYVEALPETAGPDGRVRLTRNDPVGQGAIDRAVAYDTVLHGFFSPGEAVLRRAYARIMPRNGDLWVLRVTSPPRYSDQARTLLENVRPRFVALP